MSTPLRYTPSFSLDEDFGFAMPSYTPASPARGGLVALEERIQALRFLPRAWDGYEGEPPTSETISDAISLLRLLHAPKDLPVLSLGGSGALSLYWNEADRVVDVEFDGSGTFALYATLREEIVHSDEFPITSAAVANLKLVLAEILP